MSTQKRLILAAILCVAVILLYQLLFQLPRSAPGEEDLAGETEGAAPETAKEEEEKDGVDEAPPAELPDEVTGDVERVTHRIASDLVAVEIGNGPGLVADVEPLVTQFEIDGRGVDFTRLQAKGIDSLEVGFVGAETEFDWGRRRYDVVSHDERHVSLASRSEEVAVTQRIELVDGYELRYEVTVHDLREGCPAGATECRKAHQLEVHTRMGLPAEANRYDSYRAICRTVDGVEAYTEGNDDEPALHSDADWVGLDSNYFLSALVPASAFAGCRVVGDPDAGILEVIGVAEHADLAPQESHTYSFGLYFGPKDKDLLERFRGQGPPGQVRLSEAIDWGWFLGVVSEQIGGFMLLILRFFHQMTGIWGLAIIMLTATVKLILLPLTLKQYRSMRRMQEIQPEMTAIREKYAEDKTKMNQEVQALFQRTGVNPFAGCLPVLVQLPIWIALYSSLQHAVELYNTPFLWLPDLTKTDPFYVLPLGLGGLMWVQMQIQPQAGDPQQAKMMKIFMPIFFVVMFWFMPSGLGVYIFANMLLSLVQSAIQLRAKKAAPPTDSNSVENHAKPKKR